MGDSLWSGSGDNSTNITEYTNIMFNCRMSDLSSENVTNSTFWSLRDSVGQGGIAIALFESIILLLAFGWNLFIFITFLIKYKLLKEPANILIFAVSITDIFICILIIPFPLVVAASGEFIIGSTDKIRCVFCSFQGYFFMLMTELSIHFLALLSIDRCFLLSKPLKYKTLKPRWTRFIVISIFCILFMSALLALPPAFGFGEWEFNRNFGLCLPRWTPFGNGIYMILLFFEGLIPIIILAVTNIWTYKIVNRFLRRNLERRKSFRVTQEEIETEQSAHRSQQSQLVKVFGALFIANIASWSPLLIVMFLLAVLGGDSLPNWIYIIGWFFYLLNPTAHPILESFFIKELRARVVKARDNVRTQVRRASQSIIRMATLEGFKDIPTMRDEDESEKSRSLFGLKKKGTSQSLNSTVSSYVGDESPRNSPTAVTRKNTLNNTDINRRSGSPLESSNSQNNINSNLPDLRRVSPLPSIDELSQLETSNIEAAYQHRQPHKMKSTSSLSDQNHPKRKNRHISITLPGEKDVYYPEHHAVSPSSSNSSSNDSVILTNHSDIAKNAESATTAHGTVEVEEDSDDGDLV